MQSDWRTNLKNYLLYTTWEFICFKCLDCGEKFDIDKTLDTGSTVWVMHDCPAKPDAEKRGRYSVVDF